MAYTKQGPFADGVPPAVSAARLNAMDQGIADAHAGVRKVPSCRLGQTGAGWSVPDNGGFSDLTGGWNTEAWDNDNMHDPVTHPERITFNTAGIYLVTVGINIEGGAGERFARVSGSLAAMGGVFEIDRAQSPAFANDIITLKIVTPVVAAVGDYIYVQAGSYQKGSACSITTNPVGTTGYGEPMFSALKLGDLA